MKKRNEDQLLAEIAELKKELGAKRRIITNLGQFVEPVVAQSIISGGHLPFSKGERKILSILFSDVRNFTTHAEKMDPETVIQVVNILLQNLGQVIFEHGGTVDKVMGDCIMAIFGIEGEDDHAAQAVKAAIAMQVKMASLQKIFAKLKSPELEIRIGVNTGEVVVGYVGTAGFKDFTSIGDHVNIASRLEGLNKETGTKILVGGNTYRLARKYLPESFFERLGNKMVKGKTKEVEVYQVLLG